MSVERILLEEPIPEGYAEELGKRLFFVSADIADFELIVRENQICEIKVTTQDHNGESGLADKINFVIANDIVTQKIFPPKVVWRLDEKRDYEADVFERLVAQDMAFEAAEGQVCLGEPLITLMDTLDARIKDIAGSALGAREYRYPTLIPVKVLQSCGYFDSFPQLLMFVTRLHNDVDTYRAFADEYQVKGGMGPFALAHCENLDYCLPPTMCYHTYHHLRNNQVGNRVVTSRGKSFRFESKYRCTLERLWDFTIREIVFLGAKDFVLDCRRRFMEAAFAFMGELGLVGHCEVANDPFFCSHDTAAKIFSQKMMELKYELRLKVDDARTIAVGSFNFHEQFFGESFEIGRDDGEWVDTGCVGFGLERLVYAFLCQHGLDEKRWPPILSKGA